MKRYSGINGINGIRTRTGWLDPWTRAVLDDHRRPLLRQYRPPPAISNLDPAFSNSNLSDVISVILAVTTRHGSIPVGMRQEAGTHRQAQPERKSTAVTVQRSSFQERSAYCVCERGGRQDKYCKYSRICKYVKKTERGNKDSDSDFER